MGQYYNILTYKNRKYTIYDRSTKKENEEPEYMFAKIMEHSWIHNYTMDSFSNTIFENPTKVAWVGDYADECENEDIHNEKLSLEKVLELHQIAWKSKENYLDYNDFETEKMLLVNWDKKQYVNMQEYIENNTYDGWCIHPLSLLQLLEMVLVVVIIVESIKTKLVFGLLIKYHLKNKKKNRSLLIIISINFF